MTEQEICSKLKTVLKPGRYQHTLGVADTAVRLAERYGTSVPKARLAGLLHDCGKEASDALGHAEVGAQLAESVYGVTDPEILSAIRCHTTGKPAMSLLDKILFVADYIEPGREQAPELPRLRQLAFQDLDRTVLGILEETLAYLKESGVVIDPRTQETCDYYQKQEAEKHG